MRTQLIDSPNTARRKRSGRGGFCLLGFMVVLAFLVWPRALRAQDEWPQNPDESTLNSTIETATTELDNDLARVDQKKGSPETPAQTGGDRASTDQASSDQTSPDQTSPDQTSPDQTSTASDGNLSGTSDQPSVTAANPAGNEDLSAAPNASGGDSTTGNGFGNAASGADAQAAAAQPAPAQPAPRLAEVAGNSDSAPIQSGAKKAPTASDSAVTSGVAAVNGSVPGAVGLATKSELAADSANLMKMANDLKSEVDKTTQDTLSVTVVRQAAEIEQLAHKMRSK